MAKQISKTEFVQDVQNGMTKAQLVKKYEVPASWVATTVKSLGLKLKRAVEPKYVLVDEVSEVTNESTGY
jgi:hypothetical protein